MSYVLLPIASRALVTPRRLAGVHSARLTPDDDHEEEDEDDNDDERAVIAAAV